jgi:chromosome segregation ATPase
VTIENLRLKRGVFGFSPAAVRDLFAERERLFAKVSEDARTARTELHQTKEQLAGVRRELDERAEVAEATLARVEELETEIASLRQRVADQTDLTASVEARLAEANAELATQREAAQLSFERAERATGRIADLEAAAAEHDALVGTIRRELDEARRRADEREAAERAAAGAAETARREAERLRADLARVEVERGRFEAELAAVREAAPATISLVERSPSQEIASAIDTAEEAVQRIIESGRQRVAQDLEEAERRRDEVEAEIEELESWRAMMQEAMVDVRGALGDARSRITTVEEQLHQALDPLALTLLSLGDRLSRLQELGIVPQPATDPGSPADVAVTAAAGAAGDPGAGPEEAGGRPDVGPADPPPSPWGSGS